MRVKEASSSGGFHSLLGEAVKPLRSGGTGFAQSKGEASIARLEEASAWEVPSRFISPGNHVILRRFRLLGTRRGARFSSSWKGRISSPARGNRRAVVSEGRCSRPGTAQRESLHGVERNLPNPASLALAQPPRSVVSAVMRVKTSNYG
jgi:hypothetical protein